MRSSKCIETESVKASDAKRPRELQSESDLLELLYTDPVGENCGDKGRSRKRYEGLLSELFS